MDGQRFDLWIRRLGQAESRRTLFGITLKGAVAAAVAAVGLGGLGVDEAAAGKCQKRCRKKYKQKKQQADSSAEKRRARAFKRRCLKRCGTTGQRGCAFDAQCATGRICQNGTCTTRTCTASNQCGRNRVCQDGRCTVRPCADQDDCGADYACIGDVCLPRFGGCAGGPDQCPDGTTCNANTDVCEPGGSPCTTDEDCGGVGTCNQVSGLCEAAPPCEEATDCLGGAEVCSLPLGICVPNDLGCLLQLSECTSTDDCCDGLICSNLFGVCTPILGI